MGRRRDGKREKLAPGTATEVPTWEIEIGERYRKERGDLPRRAKLARPEKAAARKLAARRKLGINSTFAYGR